MNIVYTSFGAPFFAKYLAERTRGKFQKPTDCLYYSKKDRNINLFMVGMYYPKHSFYTKIGRFKKIIILFAGSDIIRIKSYSKNKRSKLLNNAVDRGAIFATESPLIRDYIKSKFKIDTEVIYLPSSYKSSVDPAPFPKRFSIGCYMPCGESKGVSKRYFYGFSKMLEVVKRVSDVDFHFYGWNGYVDVCGETKLSNFISYKNTITDMPSFLKNVSCGLRIVEHDTYSMSAIEYVMEGRWFINNHEMPYCEKVSHDPSIDEIVDVVNKVKNRSSMNVEGKKVYDINHSIGLFKGHTKEIFRR